MPIALEFLPSSLCFSRNPFTNKAVFSLNWPGQRPLRPDHYGFKVEHVLRASAPYAPKAPPTQLSESDRLRRDERRRAKREKERVAM